jgi:hypothetical protein
MDIGEVLLRKHIDDKMLSFIKKNISDFESLDIIRFFGLNPSSRVDVETLCSVTNNDEEEMTSSLKTLADKHVIHEVIVDGKNLYELTASKDIVEYVKRFISYYNDSSIRIMLIGYFLNKSIDKKGS